MSQRKPPRKAIVPRPRTLPAGTVVFHVAPPTNRKQIGREGLRPLGTFTRGMPVTVYVFTEIAAARMYAFWVMRRISGGASDLWQVEADGLTFLRDPQGSAKMLYTTDLVGPERLALLGKA